MSCNTLDQQTTRLSVSSGMLPEGFCPESMQDLLNAFAARLIVTPSANFSGVVLGSLEPSGNAGPWLKNCEEWFVWDDATSRYVPIAKQGFNNMQYYGASDTFIVPAFIYKLRIHAWGAGGGGSNTDGGGSTGSGGGGGAYGLSIVTVTPGQVINFTVGAGGAGSTGVATAGGDTLILGKVAGGAAAAAIANNITSGTGGVAVGFDINFNGQSGMANSGGSSQTASCNGGDAGGWGGKGATVTANLPSAASKKGLAPGGGGSGGSNSAANTGGAGADGGVLFEW